MKGGKHWIAIAVLVLSAALLAGWLAWQRSRGDGRLLLGLLPPDADAYAVLDLEVLQSNPAVRKLIADPPDAALSSDYRQLLRQTGFRYQEDLKQVAVAKLGSDWVGTAVVDADRPRLTRYLESQGAVQSELEGRTVYSFGSGHPFRLAFIDDRRVAFAVGTDVGHLRGILERSANRTAVTAAAELREQGWLQRYPAGSGLWFVGRMDRVLKTNPEGAGIGPFHFGKEWWEGSKVVFASVVSSPLHLDIHLESQCESAAAAARMANAFKAVLAILRAVPKGESESPNYAPLLAAVAIRQSDAAVLLDWHWDPQMLALLAPQDR